MTDHESLFRSIMQQCCAELFAAYGIDIVRVPPAHNEAGLESLSCGIIGFTGERARGALVLAATEGVLKASQPVEGSPRAWLAELANQLLGRVKNRFVEHGLELRGSTPVALQGRHLRVVCESETCPSIFSARSGWMLAWMDLELDDDFVLERTQATQPMAEGDFVLF